MPPERLAEIRARVEAAEGGWHVVDDPAEPYRFEIHGDGPTIVAVFGGDSYPVRENAEFAAHAREDVPALLAEVDRQAREIERLTASAELVAEYRVPVSDNRWFAVRRKPGGDRWAIVTSHLIDGFRHCWDGTRWTYTQGFRLERWVYDSADAALAESRRLAEAGEPR